MAFAIFNNDVLQYEIELACCWQCQLGGIRVSPTLQGKEQVDFFIAERLTAPYLASFSF